MLTFAAGSLALSIAAQASPAEQPATVTELKVTTLSTMLTEIRGVGEWGFAALVEADGHRLLFDTGARPDTVLKNAAELGVDLGTIETVILSHNHWDHTGGLVQLRRTLKSENPPAVRHAHVGQGMFLPRSRVGGSSRAERGMASRRSGSAPTQLDVREVREAYEALGGRFTVHDEPHELLPGIWITGPIPRRHPEKNWTTVAKIQRDGELVEDTIPEDQALIIDTTEGLVVLAGCAHAGIVNTTEYAREIVTGKPIHAVLGGFHLLNLTDEKVAWTGAKMREFGAEHLEGTHCTGINAVAGLRAAAGLTRETAVVGAVGTTFTLGLGIQLGRLNR